MGSIGEPFEVVHNRSHDLSSTLALNIGRGTSPERPGDLCLRAPAAVRADILT